MKSTSRTKTKAALALVLGVISCSQSMAQQAAKPALSNAYEPLSSRQSDGLYKLALVWGFLKYHGRFTDDPQMDERLTEVMPAVMRATSDDELNGVLLKLSSTTQIDPLIKCGVSVSTLPDPSKWISNKALLGASLSAKLSQINCNAPQSGNFYVARGSTGAAEFVHEANGMGNDGGADIGPEVGMIALFRYWNIIRYWYPYRDDISRWDGALREMIPVFHAIHGREDYENALLMLLARIHDTHAQLGRGGQLIDHQRSDCHIPVKAIFSSDGFVVVNVLPGSEASPLIPGDVIKSIDGVAIDSSIDRLSGYYSASNRRALLRNMSYDLLQGPCGPTTVRVKRDRAVVTATAMRIPNYRGLATTFYAHGLPGESFRMLNPSVAYLRLSGVSKASLDDYVSRSNAAGSLIVDARGYPSDFIAYALGARFAKVDVVFAKLSEPDLAHPGRFVLRDAEPIRPSAVGPNASFKMVILVDATTQSAAEYFVMAMQGVATPWVIGSQTAGADGDVAKVPLPGGYVTEISGLGVLYPDGTVTQGAGIKINEHAETTALGASKGLDELLERAVARLTHPARPGPDLNHARN